MNLLSSRNFSAFICFFHRLLSFRLRTGYPSSVELESAVPNTDLGWEKVSSSASSTLCASLSKDFSLTRETTSPLVPTLNRSRQNSLILLYRLLFILFAEDRKLLPYHMDRAYTDNRSLDAFETTFQFSTLTTSRKGVNRNIRHRAVLCGTIFDSVQPHQTGVLRAIRCLHITGDFSMELAIPFFCYKMPGHRPGSRY